MLFLNFSNQLNRLVSYLTGLGRVFKQSDLDKGYALYEKRNAIVKSGKPTRKYSKEEIRLMMLAIDDINDRVRIFKNSLK